MKTTCLRQFTECTQFSIQFTRAHSAPNKTTKLEYTHIEASEMHIESTKKIF